MPNMPPATDPPPYLVMWAQKFIFAAVPIAAVWAGIIYATGFAVEQLS
jgi:hypothetical protein